MSRLDEMIYHVEVQAKIFDSLPFKSVQLVEGQERPCCLVCGNCPSAEAEWLRAIRNELTGERQAAKPRTSKTLPTKEQK